MSVHRKSLGLVVATVLIATWVGAGHSAQIGQGPSDCALLEVRDATARGEQWAMALQAGRLDELVGLYAEDAALLIDERAGPIHGRDAIRSYFATLAGRHPAPRFDKRSVGSRCGAATETAEVRIQVTGKRKGTRMFIGGRIATSYVYAERRWLITEQRLPVMTIPNRAQP